MNKLQSIALCIILGLLLSPWAAAQTIGGTNTNTTNSSFIGGVYIDPQGVVRHQQPDAKGALAAVREQGRLGTADDKLTFVSLPRLLAEVKQLTAAGKPLPPDLKYLGGLTQLRYILLYPESNDLVLAGPAEEIDSRVVLQPVGKRTGRPVLQLDDLVVILRAIAEKGTLAAFGCSIDPAPDALAKSQEVMSRSGRLPRNQLMAEMAQAIGPQRVTFFGGLNQSRAGLVCVAADYQMKRMSLGFEPSSVGTAVDNSRSAANRFWFETSYQPLLVSGDKDAYELRGPRLTLKAGAQPFDERGATETAQRWAKAFADKIPTLANTVPLYADLQNLADLSVLAVLIKQDQLDKRSNWDWSWLRDGKAYPIAPVAVPTSAETLVGVRSGSLVAGGVSINSAAWTTQRQADEKNALQPVKQRGLKRQTASTIFREE